MSDKIMGLEAAELAHSIHASITAARKICCERGHDPIWRESLDGAGIEWFCCRCGVPCTFSGTEVGRIERLELDSMAQEIAALHAELGRLRTALRVNGLRWGMTDAEIGAVLYPEGTETKG